MADSNDMPAVSPETARRMANLIGLFELAASMGDDLTEGEARVVLDAERAAHGTAEEV
ncbi:hypothetical protein AB0K34_14180 [Actinomadura sp. NPDC049382]|uniref:hypothetical protein n=1 Tax=Actinomadura sp. NPDC049382 TaxID=3158220 RepID=UPI003438939D